MQANFCASRGISKVLIQSGEGLVGQGPNTCHIERGCSTSAWTRPQCTLCFQLHGLPTARWHSRWECVQMELAPATTGRMGPSVGVSPSMIISLDILLTTTLLTLPHVSVSVSEDLLQAS